MNTDTGFQLISAHKIEVSQMQTYGRSFGVIAGLCVGSYTCYQKNAGDGYC